jgi:hypothetical protein
MGRGLEHRTGSWGFFFFFFFFCFFFFFLGCLRLHEDHPLHAMYLATSGVQSRVARRLRKRDASSANRTETAVCISHSVPSRPATDSAGSPECKIRTSKIVSRCAGDFVILGAAFGRSSTKEDAGNMYFGHSVYSVLCTPYLGNCTYTPTHASLLQHNNYTWTHIHTTTNYCSYTYTYIHSTPCPHTQIYTTLYTHTYTQINTTPYIHMKIHTVLDSIWTEMESANMVKDREARFPCPRVHLHYEYSVRSTHVQHDDGYSSV